MIWLYLLWIAVSIWFVGFVTILFFAGVHKNSIYVAALWIFILLAMFVQPLDMGDDETTDI